MNATEREQLLAECLEDYHRRRALREPARAGDYSDRLGEGFQEFLDILAAESAIDQVIETSTAGEIFPRPFGSYTILGELGGGAMGMVYEAVHRTLGRKVALKILRTGFDTEPLALERFRREARACAQIRHDHIVEIYEVGMEEGRPFYAMPVLEGRSLLELIKAGEVPSPEELCAGVAGIADALHVMHEAGIVHRDVKPANIMVDETGRMVLADFGLARTAASQTLTQTGQALGTPLYMSPEQILGANDEVDGRSDIYGLGVTLYECLSGAPPFRADNFHALMRMILSERPRLLTAVAPDVPLGCAHVTMKAIEWDKKHRYRNAAEMRDDLLAFAKGEEVTGRPIARWRHMLRRNRKLIVSAAAAILLTVGVVFGWGAMKDAEPGTLVVDCHPLAEVLVNGERRGVTRFIAELPPGDYQLTLAQNRFTSRILPVRIAPGASSTVESILMPLDRDDPIAEAMLADSLGVKTPTYQLPPVHRGRGDGEPILAVFPRGAVRLADLAKYRIEILDDMLELNGTLEFRRGEEVLHSEEFDPEMMVTTSDLPQVVRDALAVGDAVTWGYFPEDGDPLAVEFTVVESEVDSRFEDLERRLAGKDAGTLAVLKSQALLNEGLLTAAYHEASRIAAERPQAVRAIGVMVEALNQLELSDSKLGNGARKALLRIPEEKRKFVIRD